ncbi:MAG TPA: M28 family peptidase [Patescibacteria group bacterium]|nr:M28 family peptidase [Patescibacteria group bacterium]
MRGRKWLPLLALAAVLAAAAGVTLRAQQGPLPPVNGPGQLGPKPPVGSGGCSVTAPTCADVAPAIIRSALGPSPLQHNIHYLTRVTGAAGNGPAAQEQVLQWAVQAFRQAGVDQVRLETYTMPPWARTLSPHPAGGRLRAANVVAEIRGREEPDEFVILGADLDAGNSGAEAADDARNAALVIDAARAIHAAGTRPARSIRFILFTGKKQGDAGTWAYVRAHRSELNQADAVIIYDAGDGPVSGYDLSGRRSLEAPLRKALAPAAQFGASHDVYTARMGADNFDFLLEGVPTLVAASRSGSPAPGNADPAELKRNVALAALTAYGIADLPERLGKRQTRPEIEELLERTGLENKMKKSEIWSEWRRGERGRPR